MPKSKELAEDSDSEDFKPLDKSNSGSEEEAAKKKSKAKKSSNKNDPPAKRVKTSDDTDDGTAVAATIGPNGERLYEVGKLRFVSVSQFKGKPYVNIREYYEDNGARKPGRKGISLAGDQWEKFKELIDQVDKDLKNSK